MASNGKTVLLVEDNEDNRIVYSTILRHFGYEVSEALNGEEGIAKARAEKPDLILMDISIPIIDGWEATQVLKHDPDDARHPDHRAHGARPGVRPREGDGSGVRRLSRQAVRAARRGGRGAALPRQGRDAECRLRRRAASRRAPRRAAHAPSRRRLHPRSSTTTRTTSRCCGCGSRAGATAPTPATTGTRRWRTSRPRRPTSSCST